MASILARRLFASAPRLARATLASKSSTPVPTVWATTAPDAIFSVGEDNGLMPRIPPLQKLPDTYADLEDILTQMPIRRKDGGIGLLARGELGAYVQSKLQLHDVTTVTDPHLATALFRDYSVLASAYLLEPSHLAMACTGSYGEARDHLPETIAVPLAALGARLDSYPFLDYAQGYALNNWAAADPAKPLTLSNLRMIRQFEGGADEAGFVLIHVAMVAQSGSQVAAVQRVVAAAASHDHQALAEGLQMHRDFLRKIYEIFITMWQASRPKGYLGFRTFIMGVTGNESIFPRKVLYKGVDPEPRAYRGETGAQDTMIPISDSLLEMPYPRNNLTEYLMDLRAYRPKDHRAYLQWVQHAAAQNHVKAVALERSVTSLRLLENLDVMRRIRNQHWTMTKAYIISNTKHPKATGGTPITTWLPNQLGSTLEYMLAVCVRIRELQAKGDTLSPADNVLFCDVETDVTAHVETLRREVRELQDKFQEQELDEFEKRKTA